MLSVAPCEDSGTRLIEPVSVKADQLIELILFQRKSIMGFNSNLYINLTVAEAAHSALLDKLEAGWEQEEDRLEAEWEKLIFTATLTHEGFDGDLKLTYQMDETALICICVELNSRNYTDTVKKGFPNDDDYMEPEEMIEAAAKVVNLGMDLLLLSF